MLELLRGKNLCNVIVIVTRYFGGILLGTGGLVRAYAGATKLVLEEVKYYCRKEQIKIVKEEYSDNVIIFIELSNKKLEKMKKEIDNLTLKILRINKMEEKYI